jgi:hypothetical protein
MLGTPDETIWPGVSQLPDYTSRFPRWEAINLGDVLPNFDDDAKDLISVSMMGKADILAEIYPRVMHLFHSAFLCF